VPMKIKPQINIMGEQLPIESVRTASEIQAQFDAAVQFSSQYNPIPTLQFARGVQSAIEWMLRKRIKPPFRSTP